MNRKIGLLCVGLLCGLFPRAKADGIQKEVETGWDRVLKNFYSPQTHLIYACAPDRVTAAKNFTNGMLVFSEKNGKGYGHGMEDCSISGGVALSMLCDRYAVTREQALVAQAKQIAQGLCGLATVHGVKGYVVRGICPEDGKSVCTLSSRDQVTHFIHGLWRYYHSPLSDNEMKAKIREVFTDVSERMIKYVTPENDYNFMMLNGDKDPRGVCKMWNCRSHEAARLPMIYIATWDVTRNKRYQKEYLKYAKDALKASMTLMLDMDWETRQWWMPDYTLLQMNSSLEVIAGSEWDADRKRAARLAMRGIAEIAAERAKKRGVSSGTYLCAAGEIALAQLMTPDFVYRTEQKDILLKTLRTPTLDKAGAVRIVHLSAAYWRLRVLGMQLEEK